MIPVKFEKNKGIENLAYNIKYDENPQKTYIDHMNEKLMYIFSYPDLMESQKLALKGRTIALLFAAKQICASLIPSAQKKVKCF